MSGKRSQRATRPAERAAPDRPPVRTEISSGGVVYRNRAGRIDVALISVGEPPRWQLPKGLVDRGEKPEETAVREVREEAGVQATLVAPLDRIGYWYQRTEKGARVRVRKFVHFYLLRYRSGNVRQHDSEVLEARWVPLDDAGGMLAFATERKVLVEAARKLSGEPAG
ncbi:MAG TPA: NUDIX domain-containing protein [Gemmatimonadaceae bacterium]|nr:NUDIX domain-containing protein [Gemmatimonadaceae bacterium]